MWLLPEENQGCARPEVLLCVIAAAGGGGQREGEQQTSLGRFNMLSGSRAPRTNTRTTHGYSPVAGQPGSAARARADRVATVTAPAVPAARAAAGAEGERLRALSHAVYSGARGHARGVARVAQGHNPRAPTPAKGTASTIGRRGTGGARSRAARECEEGDRLERSGTHRVYWSVP